MTVKEMIAKKQSKKENKHLEIRDINHDLIISIFATAVYGKPARDEDILSIIIGGPGKAFERAFDKLREQHKAFMKDAGTSVKRKKNGVLLDKDGFIILQPK